MFETMRRKDRLLSEEETRKILTREAYGVLATVGENGYPYGVPLSYAYENGVIYFHGAAREGAKCNNLAYCHKVSFTVVGGTQVLPGQFSTLYESVVIFGTAERLTDPEAKQKALEAIISKFSPGFYEGGLQYIEKMGEKADVFCLTPEQITGKAKR